ncbi:family 7 polysaccharide lyase, partial [Cryphonectria parasitica EP155]
ALNPACAPGGNFDLSIFNLQLPIADSSGGVTTIPASELEGCDGFQDQYFFTNTADGSLGMKVPGTPAATGCVTTSGSSHCRTELREDSPSSWSPYDSVNRLSASLTVFDAGGSTCVGQIHIDDSISSKPVCELYYYDSGAIVMGVEQTTAGGNQVTTTVGSVPVGTAFSYEIRYENNELSVQINDDGFQVLSTYELDGPDSYFKVGNYLQGDSASDVHFYSIDITH